jgi:hypothetical protein
MVPIPLVNGQVVPFRVYTEGEHAEIRERQAKTLWHWYERGKPRGWFPNSARQFWVEILVPCKPGDDLTFDEHPEEYDQLWVRFPLRDGGPTTGYGHMVLSGENPAHEL